MIYKQLLACELKGRPKYIAESGKEYDVGLILRRFVTDQALALEIKHYGNVINIRNSGSLGSVTAAETIDGSFNATTTTTTTSNLPAVRPSQALTPPGFLGSLMQLIKTHFGPSK